jgi:hypothetical protein
MSELQYEEKRKEITTQAVKNHSPLLRPIVGSDESCDRAVDELVDR